MTMSGKAAIVTGAGGGLGAAIAEALAGAGARVTISYNRNRAGAEAVVSRIAAAGGEAQAVQADLRARQGARDLARRHLDRFGSLHILVNNAGDMIRLRLPTPTRACGTTRSTSICPACSTPVRKRSRP
jgi:NAD(P)-dependent dehydrogenase (short-subunit alcohol dehydrogenase family)